MCCWPEDRRTRDLATHPEEKEAKRVDMCPYTETLDVYSLAARGVPAVAHRALWRKLI